MNFHLYCSPQLGTNRWLGQSFDRIIEAQDALKAIAATEAKGRNRRDHGQYYVCLNDGSKVYQISY